MAPGKNVFALINAIENRKKKINITGHYILQASDSYAIINNYFSSLNGL